MEQVLEWLGTVLRVMLAGMIALTPGTIGWLVILSVFLAIRWVGRGDLYRRLRHRGRTA
jgi:hypothetical protein